LSRSFFSSWRVRRAAASAALAIAGATGARAQDDNLGEYNSSLTPHLIVVPGMDAPLQSNLSLMPAILSSLASEGNDIFQYDFLPSSMLEPDPEQDTASPVDQPAQPSEPSQPPAAPPEMIEDSMMEFEGPLRRAESAEEPLPFLAPQIRGEGLFTDLTETVKLSADPRAPAWVVEPRVGVEEIYIDNVNATHANHQSDIISRLSAGVDVTADTPHLRGFLDATGFYRRAIVAHRINDWSFNGLTAAEARLFQDLLFLDIGGGAHRIEALGLGVPNPALLSPSEALQTVSITASPDLRFRVGDVGLADARYAYSHLWVTEGKRFASGHLGGSTRQEARADVIVPGTLTERLLSDVLLNGSSDEVSRFPGTLYRGFGEALNLFHLTRSIAAVLGGGYESLSDQPFPRLTGNGGIWDIGAHWRPNADSTVIVLYGRHDLHTAVSGEVRWHLTPYTAFYASHTESLNGTQQSLILNNMYALLGTAGPLVGVTPAENPTIAALNNITLDSFSPARNLDLATGFPLEAANNILPAVDGFFRLKLTRGGLSTDIGSERFSLTGYHVERIALTNQKPPITKADGVKFEMATEFNADLIGRAETGYAVIDESDGKSDFQRSWSLNFAGSATYIASPTLDFGMRFDHILREFGNHSGRIIINTLTLRVAKRF
jgi:hypothetical protein